MEEGHEKNYCPQSKLNLEKGKGKQIDEPSLSAHLIEVECHGNLQTNRGTTRQVVSFEERPSLINVVTRSQ